MAVTAERGTTLGVVPGAAVVSLVLLDLLRLWLPAVLVVLGDAGSTSATVMASLGLAPLAVPLGAALLVARVAPDRLFAVALPIVVVARLAVVLLDGGVAQAAVVGVGVAAAGVAIVSIAASIPGGAGGRIAVLLGLSASALLHASTGSVHSVWLGAPVGVAISGAIVLALVALGPRTAAALRELGGAPSSARASRWILLGPVLALAGVLTTAPGRISVATGWPSWQVAVTIATIHVLALLAAVLAVRVGPAVSGWTGGAAVLLGTAGALQPNGWSSVLATGVLASACAVLLATDPPATVASTALRRGVAAGVGLLLFGVVIGLYYTSYDISLPLANRWLLLAAALVAALLGVVGALGVAGVRPATAPRRVPTTGVIAAGLALVALVGLLGDIDLASPPQRETAPDELRVVAYNLRFGYDVAGDFAVDEQVAVLREAAADIIVLNEVDRGWYISGGHDVLALVAGELGLPHVRFAPAADEVFGNALLSRFPLQEFTVERLPRGSDAMDRSQFAAVLDVDAADEAEVGAGRLVGVIGTHLSHVDDQGDTRLPQARAVAGTVARLRERQIPTIVAGDLNAGPDSPEVASLTTLLVDVLPRGYPTYPADAPTEEIDRVLASPDLRVRSADVPVTTASDHRPVVVTLRLLPSGG